MPVLFPWLPSPVTDPNCLGKSERQDNEPERSGKIPLRGTSVAVEKLVNVAVLLLTTVLMGEKSAAFWNSTERALRSSLMSRACLHTRAGTAAHDTSAPGFPNALI